MEIFPGEQKEDDQVCLLLPTEASAVVTKRDDAMEWIACAFSIDDWP